jgi:hypothetical protein
MKAREAPMTRKSGFIQHAPGELPAGLRARSFAGAQENQLYFARAYKPPVDVTIVMSPRSDDEAFEACIRREQVRRPRVPMR